MKVFWFLYILVAFLCGMWLLVFQDDEAFRVIGGGLVAMNCLNAWTFYMLRRI